MLAQQEIRSDEVPAPAYQFSQGVRKGSMIQVSGQGGVAPGFAADAPENNLAAQTIRALDNVGKVLEAGGSSYEDAVMVRLYLTTRDHFAEVCDLYDAYIAERVSGVLPARTTVIVELPGPTMLIEVDALAAVAS